MGELLKDGKVGHIPFEKLFKPLTEEEMLIREKTFTRRVMTEKYISYIKYLEMRSSKI